MSGEVREAALNAVVDHLVATGADATIVAQDGSADDLVAAMVAHGWTLSDQVEYVSGKRIRTLIPPSE